MFCGPSMVFTNVYNPRSHVSRKHEYRRTLVKRGATLGANCTIICGNTIGQYVFIGAGAVVARNVPDHALMVRSPARQIGWMCQCGEKLSNNLVCLLCEKQYQQTETGELYPVLIEAHAMLGADYSYVSSGKVDRDILMEALEDKYCR